MTAPECSMRRPWSDSPNMILDPGLDVEIPAGGFVSTATDYNHRFADAMRQGGKLDGNRVLSSAMVAFATRNHTGTMPNDLWNYARELKGGRCFLANLGLGFFLRVRGSSGPIAAIWQAYVYGAMGVGTTNYWVDPQRDMTMVCLTTGFLSGGQQRYSVPASVRHRDRGIRVSLSAMSGPSAASS